MPTIFLDSMVVSLPSRFAQGQELDAQAAEMLNIIMFRRIRAKLRYLLDRGEILVTDLQTKANELAAQPLRIASTLDDSEDDDPILIEALSIAKDIICSRMAQEGLPPPRGIDAHAKALVDGLPEIQEQARKRIEARYLAAQELINTR
jgi:hypothetical protein